MQFKAVPSLFSALILSILILGASGCNTMSGAGQDIGAAGEAITNKAEEKKKY